MYFISDKCVVGEVGSYCQLAVTFFFGLTLPNQRQCSTSVHFDPPPPFHKSGSAPGMHVYITKYVHV